MILVNTFNRSLIFYSFHNGGKRTIIPVSTTAIEQLEIISIFVKLKVIRIKILSTKNHYFISFLYFDGGDIQCQYASQFI